MSTRKIPRLRWYIAVLLCQSSVLTYLDRQTLSVLASTIQKELGMSTVQYAQITSAFLFSYTIMYAVRGLIIGAGDQPGAGVGRAGAVNISADPEIRALAV